MLTGETGGKKRLNQETLAVAVPDVSEFEVMLCGPEGFQDAMYDALGSLGVDAAQIRLGLSPTFQPSDLFVASSLPPISLPPRFPSFGLIFGDNGGAALNRSWLET